MREQTPPACKRKECRKYTPFQHWHCVGCGYTIGEPPVCGECACEDDLG